MEKGEKELARFARGASRRRVGEHGKNESGVIAADSFFAVIARSDRRPKAGESESRVSRTLLNSLSPVEFPESRYAARA
jgi:hypothetical protein